MGFAAGRERVGYAKNDEPSAFRRVKDAGAISETAGLAAQLADLAVSFQQVEHFDRFDRLRNFLSVGAYILYGRAAHSTRDSTHALDACALRRDSLRDEIIPGFAGANVEQRFTVGLPCASINPGDAHLEDESGPTAIRYQQIAAAAQNEKRQILRSRKCDRLLHLSNRFCFHEEARGSPRGGRS